MLDSKRRLFAIFLVTLAGATALFLARPAEAGGGQSVDCDKESEDNDGSSGEFFAFPGDTLDFTITCTFSPTTAGGNDRITIDDFLNDPGAFFTPGSLDCPGASFEMIEPDPPKKQATCKWEPLADGLNQVQMFVSVTIEETAQCGESIQQRFEGRYDPDGDKVNVAVETTNVDINILCPGDVELSIEKTPDGLQIFGGDSAEFTIVVGNTGDLAVVVHLTDQLPSDGLTWFFQTGPLGCEPDVNDFVDCEFVVGSDDSVTLIYLADTDDGECGETLLNEAFVEFIEPADNFNEEGIGVAQVTEASDTGSILVVCEVSPGVDVGDIEVPVPGVEAPAGGPLPVIPSATPAPGGAPRVGTGDSGTSGAATVEGWQLAIAGMLLAATLGGAYLGYRRVT